MPRLNQRTRCADVPWVKDSGTTRPCVCFCSRSSPIAVAAVERLVDVARIEHACMRCAWWPHTPA